MLMAFVAVGLALFVNMVDRPQVALLIVVLFVGLGTMWAVNPGGIMPFKPSGDASPELQPSDEEALNTTNLLLRLETPERCHYWMSVNSNGWI